MKTKSKVSFHRFDSKLCAKSSVKCVSCSDSIALGRSMSVCKECNVTTHPHCATSIPNTCGLPQGFAKHYKDSLEPKSGEISKEKLPGDETINIEGWIKVPG